MWTGSHVGCPALIIWKSQCLGGLGGNTYLEAGWSVIGDRKSGIDSQRASRTHQLGYAQNKFSLIGNKRPLHLAFSRSLRVSLQPDEALYLSVNQRAKAT